MRKLNKLLSDHKKVMEKLNTIDQIKQYAIDVNRKKKPDLFIQAANCQAFCIPEDSQLRPLAEALVDAIFNHHHREIKDLERIIEMIENELPE